MPRTGTTGVDSIWAWAGLDSLGDTGHNLEPASFAPDEQTWDKAKKAASKSYSQDDEAFWPSVVTIYKNMGGKIAHKSKEDSESDQTIGEMPSVQPDGLKPDDRAIVDAINDNPDMNASTFYNFLKAKGFQIIAPKHEEADSASSNVAVLRAQTKESNSIQKKLNIKDGFSNFKFLEKTAHNVKSDSLTGATKFSVALIQEGMGNKKDAFYYTRAALESAVPVFEGKKIYADHPDALEEKTRPERSVRDVLGHFENLHIEESDDGRAMLCGDLVILPDDPYRWARSLMTHAIEFSKKYPDKEFIGLSINASGDANPMGIKELMESGQVPKGSMAKLSEAMNEGIEQVRLVTAIKDAVSCDMVTEAGASGKILEMLERENNSMKKKETKVDPEKGFEKDMPPQQDGEQHADEQQDIELIKKMIAKHMGDEQAPKEETEGQMPPHAQDGDKDGDADHDAKMKHALEAYEYYAKERKMEGEEAAKHAAEAVKCAMHMAKKHEAMKHAESKEEEGMKHSENEEKKHESAEKKEKKEGEEKKKESDIARLAGRVAFLEGELKKKQLTEEIEKRMAASKLPRNATKAFRESIGEVKSVEDFDKLFTVFEKAYRAGGEAGHGPLDLSIEKNSRLTESVRSGETSVGFGDCVK